MPQQSTPPPPATDPAIRRVLICFALVSAVLLSVVVVAIRNINRSVATSDWVNHTHAVILEADAVLTELHAGEAALRTFAMTADARDQSTSREAFAAVAEHLEVAKALETLANKRAEIARAVFTKWTTDRNEALRVLLVSDTGGASLGEIRRAVGKLKDDEMALLAERDTAAFVQAQTTRWTVWSGVVLDLLLLSGAAWLIRDDIAARRRAAEALEAANAQLETKVQERTTELATANEKLAEENLERRWANQALEHQLRYHQMIVNAINDPVLVVTKALNISRVNPAAVHAIGREPSDLINRPLREFVWLETRSGEGDLLEPMAQALREGRDLRDHSALLADKLGRQTMVRFTLYPVRDSDKVVGGVVVLELPALTK